MEVEESNIRMGDQGHSCGQQGLRSLGTPWEVCRCLWNCTSGGGQDAGGIHSFPGAARLVPIHVGSTGAKGMCLVGLVGGPGEVI